MRHTTPWARITASSASIPTARFLGREKAASTIRDDDTHRERERERESPAGETGMTSDATGKEGRWLANRSKISRENIGSEPCCLVYGHAFFFFISYQSIATLILYFESNRIVYLFRRVG